MGVMMIILALLSALSAHASPLPSDWSRRLPIEKRDWIRTEAARAQTLAPRERNQLLKDWGQIYLHSPNDQETVEEFLTFWADQEQTDPRNSENQDPRLAYLPLLEGPLTAWSAGYGLAFMQAARRLWRPKEKFFTKRCGILLSRMARRAGPSRWPRQAKIALTLTGLASGGAWAAFELAQEASKNPRKTLEGAQEQMLQEWQARIHEEGHTLEQVLTLSRRLEHWRSQISGSRPEFAPILDDLQDHLLEETIKLRTQNLEKLRQTPQ